MGKTGVPYLVMATLMGTGLLLVSRFDIRQEQRRFTNGKANYPLPLGKIPSLSLIYPPLKEKMASLGSGRRPRVYMNQGALSLL